MYVWIMASLWLWYQKEKEKKDKKIDALPAGLCAEMSISEKTRKKQWMTLNAPLSFWAPERLEKVCHPPVPKRSPFSPFSLGLRGYDLMRETSDDDEWCNGGISQ
jgi:hypothetical protein